MPTKCKKWLIAIAILALLLVIYLVAGIVRSQYLESTLIPLVLPSRSGVSGTVRIAQVSDLHRAVYGDANQDLVDLVAQKNPDVIVATGDMIDARTPDIDDTVWLFERLARIAPVVYSLGNHELQRDDLEELLIALTRVGVQIVHNSAVDVRANGMTLRIGGLYTAEYLYELDDDGQIDILLCHFPHKLDVFAMYGVPLTFCGHTHGGQFRVPLMDLALYAPGQGWFPQYTAGLYTRDESNMIVSRGLGNSSFPFRVHNPPEIVVADVTYSELVSPLDMLTPVP